MGKFRIWLISFAIIIGIAELFFIDFSNLALPKNLGPYASIMGMILLVISQTWEIRKGNHK